MAVGPWLPEFESSIPFSGASSASDGRIEGYFESRGWRSSYDLVDALASIE